MPIQRTQQNWTTGQTVKVGFMTLRVLALIPTPGDYRPDVYVLESLKGNVQYDFTPHYGLQLRNLAEYVPAQPIPPGVAQLVCGGRLFRD